LRPSRSHRSLGARCGFAGFGPLVASPGFRPPCCRGVDQTGRVPLSGWVLVIAARGVHAVCDMDRQDDPERDRDPDGTTSENETHATTGGAVAAGAVTGGVIGLTGGPVAAAIGAVGGALVAA